MDNKVKMKFSIIMICILLNCVACTSVEHVDKEKIHKESEQWMECIVKEDADALFEYLAPRIQSNKEEVMEQMEAFFEAIDGKIISYEYDGFYGEDEHIEDGKTVYYSCHPKYPSVITDSGKEYSIKFTFEDVWKERPECEGITKISVKEVNEQKESSRNSQNESSTTPPEQEYTIIGRNIYYDD